MGAGNRAGHRVVRGGAHLGPWQKLVDLPGDRCDPAGGVSGRLSGLDPGHQAHAQKRQVSEEVTAAAGAAREEPAAFHRTGPRGNPEEMAGGNCAMQETEYYSLRASLVPGDWPLRIRQNRRDTPREAAENWPR